MYLIGMSRSYGVDIENYRRIFESSNDGRIMTFIYCINNLFYSSGFTFEAFLALIGTLNILLIYKITKFLKYHLE